MLMVLVRFADKISSRRGPMLLGLAGLLGSTVILCLGRSIAVLAIGRALQGITAAVPWVVGLALLVDTVGPEGVGVAMGYVGLSMSMAMLLAPLLGGVVFAKAGYYAVFAMAFGLIILDIFLRLVMIEKKMAVKWLPVEPVKTDQEGLGGKTDETHQAGLDIEMDEVRQADTKGASSDGKTAVEELNENTVSAPDDAPIPPVIVPDHVPEIVKHWTAHLPPVVRLLSSRRVLSAIFGCTIQATLYTSFDSILPLYVRDTFHFNSIGAGLIFLPLVISSFLGPVFGHLSDKHGPRWYATAGFILAGPCLILLRLVYKDTLDQKVLLCALLALTGTGLTMTLTPMMAEIAYAVEAKGRNRPAGYFGKNGAYAQAYSLFNVAWAGGFLIGPLLAGLTVQASGWPTSTLILGCISFATAIPVAIWTGGSIFKKRKLQRDAARALHEE